MKVMGTRDCCMRLMFEGQGDQMWIYEGRGKGPCMKVRGTRDQYMKVGGNQRSMYEGQVGQMVLYEGQGDRRFMFKGWGGPGTNI